MASAAVMVDSESYAEEEGTFDFGEEDLIDTFNATIIKEYGGEDYSQYLNEDDGMAIIDKHRSQFELGIDQLGNNLIDDDGNYYDTIQDLQEVDPISQITETHQSATSRKSLKSEKLKWLRNHISKATFGSKDRRQTTTSLHHDIFSSRDNNPNKIYNFSFADSKMGFSLAAIIQENQQLTEAGDENADSGIGLENNNEVPEVINEVPGLQISSWWSLGTLSLRLQGSPTSIISSNQAIKRHSASTPFLSDFSHLSKCTNNLNPNKSTNSFNRMWKKVTDTLSRKQKQGLSIKTEEIHF